MTFLSVLGCFSELGLGCQIYLISVWFRVWSLVYCSVFSVQRAIFDRSRKLPLERLHAQHANAAACRIAARCRQGRAVAPAQPERRAHPSLST